MHILTVYTYSIHILYTYIDNYIPLVSIVYILYIRYSYKTNINTYDVVCDGAMI